MSAEDETTIGWSVHTHAAVDLGTTTAMLVQRSRQSDEPARPCIALIHDDEVYPSLKPRARFQPLAQLLFVFHATKIRIILDYSK